MKVLPLAHFRIEPSAFSSGEVTSDVPQTPLNAKSCPEVKGLGSSDRQKFKPQLCCCPAMGLVGQLSPQRWRPEACSKDGGRSRPEQSTRLRGGCWGTITWWPHPLPPAHSPLPTPPSPSVSSLPQLVSGVRACAHRLLSTSPPVRVRPAGIPLPQFASHSSNCFSFHRFPACQAHYKHHLAQISDSVGDPGDGFGCVLSKHGAPIISFYSTLLAFNSLWSY